MAKMTEEQARAFTQQRPQSAVQQLGLLRAAVREYMNSTASYNSERQIREPSPATCERVKAAEIALREAMKERR